MKEETYRITNLTVRCPKCRKVFRIKIALVETSWPRNAKIRRSGS